MISEMTSVLFEVGLRDRQTVLRDQARCDAAAASSARERRHVLRRIVRHSS